MIENKQEKLESVDKRRSLAWAKAGAWLINVIFANNM